jgi:Protein phosphatase 2C
MPPPSISALADWHLMEITGATIGAPGRANEDYLVIGPTWAVVLDGASPPPSFVSGCIHDEAWLVARLAAGLIRELAVHPATPLADALFAAIDITCRAHSDSCDLANPSSPSSTVSIIRQRDDHVDWLVLADSPILIDTAERRVQVITDDRNAHLPDFTPECFRDHRNRPGGFWVASTVPEAAHEALTGSVPLAGLSSAAIMTDGVARYVELFQLGDWPDLLNALHRDGVTSVVRTVRRAEMDLPEISHGSNGRTVKRHDDATAAAIRFDDGRPRAQANVALVT